VELHARALLQIADHAEQVPGLWIAARAEHADEALRRGVGGLAKFLEAHRCLDDVAQEPDCPAGGMSLAPKQFNKLLDREAGVRDDATESAGSNLLVVGNNGSRVRLMAAKHHVASGLSAKNEAGALQGGANFTTREIGWELGHGRSGQSSL
jgi:hypothetical protein